MANGKQLEEAINEAVDNLLKNGYRNAELKDIFLAGVSYLADLERAKHTVHIHFDGFKFIPVATFLGAGVMAALQRLLHF